VRTHPPWLPGGAFFKIFFPYCARMDYHGMACFRARFPQSVLFVDFPWLIPVLLPSSGVVPKIA